MLIPGFVHGDGLDVVQLSPEIVQEQRANDLMNVFDGGVVHASFPPGLRVQSALKDGSEDGGADHRPVKVLAGPVEDQVHNVLVQPGDHYVLVGEQPAVDVGEGGQVLVDVGVPVLRLGVQDAKEVDEGPSGVMDVVL